MSRYLKPRDHGYLMEAAACTKVLEDLRRIEAKYARTVEKEGAVRQAEFEKVMQYHSERELQDDFGWGFITEAQYDRYRLLFQQGQAAKEQLPGFFLYFLQYLKMILAPHLLLANHL